MGNHGKVSPGYENWLIVFPRGKADGYMIAGEKNTDGTITFSRGRMAERGTLRADLETKPVTTKKERELVDHCREMQDRAARINSALYAVAKANEPNPAASEHFSHDICPRCGAASVPLENVPDQSGRGCPACGSEWFEDLSQAPTKTSPPDYDAQTFFNAYVEAALWSSYDEATPAGGEPLDKNYSAADLAPETAEQMRADCERFRAEQAELLTRYYAELPPKEEWTGEAQAGHDFWLSRNGHGAGFFDREASREVCDGLQAAAKSFGNVDLYVEDDGLIYAG